MPQVVAGEREGPVKDVSLNHGVGFSWDGREVDQLQGQRGAPDGARGASGAERAGPAAFGHSGWAVVRGGLFQMEAPCVQQPHRRGFCYWGTVNLTPLANS
jgi:hypothetical protein